MNICLYFYCNYLGNIESFLYRVSKPLYYIELEEIEMNRWNFFFSSISKITQVLYNAGLIVFDIWV